MFALGHVPGSVNIELDASFASYVGWVLPFDAPLVLVLPEPEREAQREAVIQLLRIGFEHVLGRIAGGVDAWASDGRPVRTYGMATPDDLCAAYAEGEPPSVLDVRQRVEWDRGHIPGSAHLFVGDLPNGARPPLGDTEVWVICASGQRASIAASLLDAEGTPVRLVSGGGVEDWLAACGDRG